MTFEEGTEVGAGTGLADVPGGAIQTEGTERVRDTMNKAVTGPLPFCRRI